MNKKAIWILVAVVVVVLLAIPKLMSGRQPSVAVSVKPGEVAKGGANKQPPGGGGAKGAVPVTATVLKPQMLIERIISSGTILADEAVELKSEIAGRLLAVNIHEGGRVAKGTLVAKINDAELQAQLQKSSAVLNLAQVREGSQKTLLETGAVSREAYETVARDLDLARADIALLRAQIEKTEVRAPFDGRMGMKFVSLGTYVSPGTKITSLVRDRPLKVDFSAPEKYARRIKNGDKVSLGIQGGGKVYSGTVYALDPMIDENTRTMRVRALCTDADDGIVPGAFAEVTLSLGRNDNALMVPSPALVPDAAGQKVFRVEKGKAVAVPVTTGVRDSSRVQITAGLKAGDTVITKGVLMVRPGSAVEVKGWE